MIRTRGRVKKRAQYKCEYCHLHEDESFLSYEIDHIIAIKHGGGNEYENLAYACPNCNQNKGSDLTTFLKSYDNIVQLFNPRKDDWLNHFYVENGVIISKTEIGKATIKLLKMNDEQIIQYRKILQEIGSYP